MAEHFGRPVSTSQFIKNTFTEDFDLESLFCDSDNQGSETESCFSGFDSDEEVLKLKNFASDEILLGRDISEEKMRNKSSINCTGHERQHVDAEKFDFQRNMLDNENMLNLSPDSERTFKITYSTNDNSKSSCLNGDTRSAVRAFEDNDGDYKGLEDIDNGEEFDFKGFASNGTEHQGSPKLDNKDMKHDGHTPSKNSCSIVVIPFKTLEKITPWILNKSDSQIMQPSLETNNKLSSCSLPVNEQEEGRITHVLTDNSKTIHAYNSFPPQLKNGHIENYPSKPLIIGPGQPGPDYLRCAPERIEEVIAIEDMKINEPENSSKIVAFSSVLMDHTYSSHHDAYLEHNYSASQIHTVEDSSIPYSSIAKEAERCKGDSVTSAENECDDSEYHFDVNRTEKFKGVMNHGKGDLGIEKAPITMEADKILNSSDMDGRYPSKIHVEYEKVMEGGQKSPVFSFKSGNSATNTSSHQAGSVISAVGLSHEICEEVTSQPETTKTAFDSSLQLKTTKNTFEGATSDAQNIQFVTRQVYNQEKCQELTFNVKSAKNACNSVNANSSIPYSQKSKIMTAPKDLSQEICQEIKPDLQKVTSIKVCCSFRPSNLQKIKVTSPPEELNEKNCQVIIVKPKSMMNTFSNAGTFFNAPDHQNSKVMSTSENINQGICKKVSSKPKVVEILDDTVSTDYSPSHPKSVRVISSPENLKQIIYTEVTPNPDFTESLGDEDDNKSNATDPLINKVILTPELPKHEICEEKIPKPNIRETYGDSTDSKSWPSDSHSNKVISSPENPSQEVCGKLTCKHISTVKTCNSVISVCSLCEQQYSKVISREACNKEVENNKVIPLEACVKEVKEAVTSQHNCEETSSDSNSFFLATSDKQRHALVSPAVKLNQEICKELMSREKSKESSSSVATMSRITKESMHQGRSPGELDQDNCRQDIVREVSKLPSGEEDIEKRMIQSVWHALSSQLMSHVSEFNLFHSEAFNKSEPCESVLSQVEENFAYTEDQNVFPFDHMHNDHNIKSEDITPLSNIKNNNVDNLNTDDSISCCNPVRERSTNNWNTIDSIDESHPRYKQNEAALKIRDLLKITRMSVDEDKFECFCKHNTVIPRKYRKGCCMENPSEHRFTKKVIKNRRENITYPFDRDLLFSSLGLVEKSLLDNERCIPSLVAHRTRQVRATKTKEKEYHRMVSQEPSLFSCTFSGKNASEKQNCKVISLETAQLFTEQDEEISEKDCCKMISEELPSPFTVQAKEISEKECNKVSTQDMPSSFAMQDGEISEHCKTVFKKVSPSCLVKVKDTSKNSLSINLNKKMRNGVTSSTEDLGMDEELNMFDEDVVTDFSFEGFHDADRRKRKKSAIASVVKSDRKVWNRSLNSCDCNIDDDIVYGSADEKSSKSLSAVGDNNNLNNNCHMDESRFIFQRRRVDVGKVNGFISYDNSTKRSVYRGKSYSRLCKQYLADCKLISTSTRQSVCNACQKSFLDADNLQFYGATECAHSKISDSSNCLQHTGIINEQNASVYPADEPVLDSLTGMQDSSNFSSRSDDSSNMCPSLGMAFDTRSRIVKNISIAHENVLFPNSERNDNIDFSLSQSVCEDKLIDSASITGSHTSVCSDSIQSVMLSYDSAVVDEEHDQVNTPAFHDSVHSVTFPHESDISDHVREKLSEKECVKASDQEERISDSSKHTDKRVYAPQNIQLPLSEDLDFVGFDVTARDCDVNENVSLCYGDEYKKDALSLELEMVRIESTNMIDPASNCTVSLIEGPTCSESGLSPLIQPTDFTLSTDHAIRRNSEKFNKVHHSLTKKRILRNVKRGSRRHAEQMSDIILRSNVRKRLSRRKTNTNLQVSERILKGQVITSQKENFPDRILTRQRVHEVKLRNSESNSGSPCHLNLPALAKSAGKRYNGRFKYNVFMKNGRRWYPCGICSHSFSSSGDLVRHMRRHTGERPFKCCICSRSYTQKGALNKHLETHEGKRPYICPDCGMRFSQKVHLKSHMRIHTGERPFRCEECGKSFARLDHLKSHENTHSSTRPFKCKLCPLAFKCCANLSKHTRIHLEDRRYRCEYCGASFIVAHSLRMHVRTHTGEKPIHCPLCNVDFRYESSLRKHASAKHPKFEVKGTVLVPMAQA